MGSVCKIMPVFFLKMLLRLNRYFFSKILPYVPKRQGSDEVVGNWLVDERLEEIGFQDLGVQR